MRHSPHRCSELPWMRNRRSNFGATSTRFRRTIYLRNASIVGHRLLNLNQEYGPQEASPAWRWNSLCGTGALEAVRPEKPTGELMPDSREARIKGVCAVPAEPHYSGVAINSFMAFAISWIARTSSTVGRAFSGFTASLRTSASLPFSPAQSFVFWKFGCIVEMRSAK